MGIDPIAFVILRARW